MNYKELETIAAKIRADVIKAIYSAGSGHPGGSLSAADIVTCLYFSEMNIDPENPDKWDRDKLVLSKGHAGPVQYAALAERGYYPVEDIMSLRKLGSAFQGHPSKGKVKGIEMSTGSLGQGISVACGMALSGKLTSDTYKVYTILGDGEIEEGQVWEAAMFAAHYKLDNLVAVVDNNGLQIDGKIEDVMSPYPIVDKFAAFGWHVITADAHDFDSLEKAFNEAETVCGQPCVIVMKSIKGKGVSFMENNVSWHGSAPNKEQYEQAVAEINEQLKSLEG